MTTWRDILAEATDALGESHEARIIIEEAAKEPYAGLLLRIDEQPSAAEIHRTRSFIARRKGGEPLQHIVGHWPFRSLELIVDNRALVPRPETEVVVEVALSELKAIESTGVTSVLDLGTGTGAIALAIATERPQTQVIGVDSSMNALDLARANRARCAPEVARRVGFVLGDFYVALGHDRRDSFRAIVSNPPYLAEDEWATLDPVVRDFDPHSALVAGPTGYEGIHAVIDGAPLYLTRPGVLVIEIAPHQAVNATKRATDLGAESVEIFPDLAGRDRVFVARW